MKGINNESTSDTSDVPEKHYRPVGAVATVMVSGDSLRPSLNTRQQDEDSGEEVHARNPYELKAAEGTDVTASYPFQGDADLQQLTFAVGDSITVKQKEDMWSWGILKKSGVEGWFPHNYVGTSFKPLPGMHEMAAKIRERREKQDAAEALEAAVSGAASTDQSSQEAGTHDASAASLVERTSNSGGETSAGAPPIPQTVDASQQSLQAGSQPPPIPVRDGAIEPLSHQHGEVSAGTTLEAHESMKVGSELPSANAAATDITRTADKTGSVSVGESSEPPKALAVGAPSLPPFLKNAASVRNEPVSSVAAPVQHGAKEANDSKSLQATAIDGVGNAGEAPPVSTRCTCAVM